MPRAQFQGASLPPYTRVTADASLLENFVGLSVDAAPNYEATLSSNTTTSGRVIAQRPRDDAGQSPSLGVGSHSSQRLRQSDRAKSPRPLKRLAQRAAESYFTHVLRRERKLDIRQVVACYRAELTQSTVLNLLISHESRIGKEKTPCVDRDQRLKHWVNRAIEDIVVPELDRRSLESSRIWRADQKRLKQDENYDGLQQAFSIRVKDLDARDSDIRRIFGDLGTGSKTAGTQVSELGKQGAQAAQTRAKRIAELLSEGGGDENMLWELKKLQVKCLERMRSSWRILVERCVVQISLVKQRGRQQHTTYVPGQPVGREDVMRALMEYEAERMELALAELLSTFERCVEDKPTEFPPLISFYRTFTPLTGSAFRAAREVSTSKGFIYDDAFLTGNQLDSYAQVFYQTMKDHLTLLMVDVELKKIAYKETRSQALRRSSEPPVSHYRDTRIINGRTFSSSSSSGGGGGGGGIRLAGIDKRNS